ncbi:hypothetical protein IP70_10250 [alpha proteobacterium AAP38]|nr:hypothetical protein IP70_10250 [alpha proteobacterium AAP38]
MGVLRLHTRLAPLAALCALLLLAACGTPKPVALVERPPDSRFVANLPDGPITPPVEPAEAAAALAEAEAHSRGSTDAATHLSVWQKAAEAGSPEGKYRYATMLSFGAAGPDKVGDGFDMLLDLAKKGHGQAAMSLWRLSKLSKSANLNQHASYWFNIARRSGDAMAVEVYDKLLADHRAKGELPPGSGTGDYFNSAITFSQPLAGSHEGVPLEYKVVAVLYPGWKRVTQSLFQRDGKSFDVLELENVEGQRVKIYFDITAWMGVPGM